MSDQRADSNDNNVTTQSVTGPVDYDRLINQFGCQRISPELLAKFQAATGKPLHPLLKREIIYSHKDLDLILDEYMSGRPFYLYTGRGPSSSSLHLGHLLPFMLTKYLQDAFDVPVVIQLTDDEKYLFRDLSFEEIERNLQANLRDIIACGFNPKKTFIFANTTYIGHLYPTVLRIERLVTNSQVAGIFGIKPSDNIGQTMFAAIQAAPSFHSSFPILFKHDRAPRRCLIPAGIDQDPFFRMTRDITHRLGPEYLKPALIHSKFFPALQGFNTKMSSSVVDSGIFLTDTYEMIEDKLKRHAVSGGGATRKLHREFGANLEIDVAYQMLKYFMEDDEALANIGMEYSNGTMGTMEVKKITTDVLYAIVKDHQDRLRQITPELIQEFTSIRPIV